MAGIGVNECRWARNKPQKGQSYISVRIHVFDQNLVSSRKYLVQILTVSGEHSRIGSRFGHQDGGTQSVAGNVSDYDIQGVASLFKEIEIIAADFFSRIGNARYIVAVEVRIGFRIKFFMYLLCDPDLFFVFDLFGLCPFPLGDVADGQSRCRFPVQCEFIHEKLDVDGMTVLMKSLGFKMRQRIEFSFVHFDIISQQGDIFKSFRRLDRGQWQTVQGLTRIAENSLHGRIAHTDDHIVSDQHEGIS